MHPIIDLLLLPIVLFSLMVLLIIARFLFMLAKYHLNKHKYNHVTHCHPWYRKPCFFRIYSTTSEALELMQEAFDKEHNQFYDVTHQGMYLGGLNMVGVSNPEDIKKILNHIDDFPQCELFDKMKDIIGNGLLTATGEHWRRNRRLLAPAFKFDFLKGLFPIMVRDCADFIKRLEGHQGKKVRAFSEFCDVLLHIVMDASVGNTLDKKLLAEHFHGIVDNGTFFFLSRFLFGKLDQYIPFDFVRRPLNEKAKLDVLVGEMLHKRRNGELTGNQETSKLKDTTGKERDFVSLMLESGMDDQDIIDNVITLLIAGHDTTANLLTWSTYYLSKYPEYQDKLKTELDEGNFNPTTIAVEELEKFPLLQNVLKEVSRLRPVAFANGRMVTKPFTTANGTYLPVGTVAHMMYYYVHQDPRYWEKPKEFIPERFADLEQKEKFAQAYFPFSNGPRICIGKDFAMQEAILILGSIVSKFTIKVNHDEVQLDTTLVPTAGGLIAQFIPRK